MDRKELKEFKKKAIAEMPLRGAEKKHIDGGNYLHQIHFDRVPNDEKGKQKWLKQELLNYFALRGIGHLSVHKPYDGTTPTFTDEEFEDMILLFQLPYLY